jgi:hypothetical protein
MRAQPTLIRRITIIAALLLTTALVQAQCPLDDSFEDNDDCASAVVAPLGLTSGLVVQGAASTLDRDYWIIQNVPDGHELFVDVLFAHTNGNIDARLYSNANCSGLVAVGSSSTSNENLTVINATGATKDYYLMVLGSSAAIDCNNYDLDVMIVPDQCLITPDDAFEPNDTCAAAAPLAASTSLGLFVTDTDPDYYILSVPANDRLVIDTLYTTGGPDAQLFLFDDAACTNQLVANYGFFGTGFISYSNDTGATADIRLKVALASGAGCNTYDMTVSILPDICLQGTDDGFEQNDSCAAATVMIPGAHTGLYVSHVDHDYYSINVADGDVLTVDINYVVGNEGRLYLTLFDDPSCANQVDSDLAYYGTGSVTWTNTTGSAVSATLLVDLGNLTGCNFYDLNVSSSADPCLDLQNEDGFEDNDDCAGAPLVGDGLTTGLFVQKLDADFFVVSVANGATLNVSALFSHATADVELFLYEGLTGCGDQASFVAAGQSVTDDESVSWTNATGSVSNYYVQVVVFGSAFNGDCNFYDLDISGSLGGASEPFCAGDGSADAGSGPVGCPCGNNSAPGAGEGCLWSGGVGATLSTSGSTLIANDDLVFTCSNARPNQPSLLVQGATLTAFPFKDGILCVGTPTERIEVVVLDAAGNGSTTSSIVTEGAVAPGDTRYYQQWFRDPGGISPCGNGSNFTGGIRILWL